MPTTNMPADQLPSPTEMEGGRKPRILWASLFTLLDTSSGAAITVREMLRQLVFRGYEVAVVGATLCGWSA